MLEILAVRGGVRRQERDEERKKERERERERERVKQRRQTKEDVAFLPLDNSTTAGIRARLTNPTKESPTEVEEAGQGAGPRAESSQRRRQREGDLPLARAHQEADSDRRTVAGTSCLGLTLGLKRGGLLLRLRQLRRLPLLTFRPASRDPKP